MCLSYLKLYHLLIVNSNFRNFVCMAIYEMLMFYTNTIESRSSRKVCYDWMKHGNNTENTEQMKMRYLLFSVSFMFAQPQENPLLY